MVTQQKKSSANLIYPSFLETRAVNAPFVRSKNRRIIHDSRCEWAHEIYRRVPIKQIREVHIAKCRPCKCCLAGSALWRDVDTSYLPKSKVAQETGN